MGLGLRLRFSHQTAHLFMLQGMVVYILGQFWDNRSVELGDTKASERGKKVPCCPRGRRESVEKILLFWLAFSFEAEAELDRATSGSGKAYARPAVGASAL